MQRPTEILWFERIIIGTLILGILNTWLTWPQLVALRDPVFLLATLLLTLAVMLALTLFVSRRRSIISKWIMVGLFVIGLPLVFQQASSRLLDGSLLITLTQIIGQVVAYTLLFRPASKRWFRRERTLA